MTTRRGRILLLGLSLVLVASCGGSSPESAVAETPEPSASASAAEPTPTAVPAPTAPPAATVAPRATATPEPVIEPVVFADDFATSVAPIFAEHCASCHNERGPGAAHWQLNNVADLVATHEWISQIVTTQYMPPWPSSDLSPRFFDERNLREDEIAAIVAWSAAGAPIDVDETEPVNAPQGVVALDTDVEIAPHESYTGSTAVSDDYRCFIYDLGRDNQGWMSGFEFVPDQTEIVHHAIGYLVDADSMDRALELSAEDEAGGWQCYGGSRLWDASELFLGWAPGQLPTQFPAGTGIPIEPGSFIVLQIHYHFDNEAPTDASTLRIDWSDEADLDPIRFDQFLGPAEIPCAADETGPLCDREAAMRRALVTYGPDGVLADGINGVCGVRPEDFATMTDGIASSSCTLPVRSFGEIVSVFGHEHEIGKSFRMTLNAGTPQEQVLLDIPDWSFDWQYNYYPSESIVLERGDRVLIECEWDRSRRDPALEPAYVLWADGTNDEMCFGMIAVRDLDADSTTLAGGSESNATESNATESNATESSAAEAIARCTEEAGFNVEQPPVREEIDNIVDAIYRCAEPEVVGQALAELFSENFGGLVDEDGLRCIADRFSDPAGTRGLLYFVLPDATEAERTPVADLVADCVMMSAVLREFGIPLDASQVPCVDEVGRPLVRDAMLQTSLPETQAIFAVIAPCLAE